MLYDYRQIGSPFALQANETCSVIHFRKGDRSINEQIDVFELCRNSSKARKDSSIQCPDKHDLKIGRCINWGSALDMGCSNFPFAAVKLHHGLNKVSRLVGPNKKTVLIMTDEDEWLQHQLDQNPDLIKGWNIRFFPRIASEATNLHQGAGGRDGTYNGVRFYASMKLVQQCEAFIGHFGSAATHNFFASMCVENNGTQGVCPPAYDLRLLGKEIGFHIPE
jgi:hypothetical protein